MSSEAMRRALGYPYPVPALENYLFTSGVAAPLPADWSLKGRVPVLAVGSNRSPEQLVRKYGRGRDVVIPVTSMLLPDHDVAYCAYLTSYGSVPASLTPVPGCKVALRVTWLTATQLQQMHTTESVGSHTDFGQLSLTAASSAGHALPYAYTYVSKRGYLSIQQQQPTALEAITAQGRALPSLSQVQVLAWVHKHHGNGPFADWLQGVINNDKQRAALNNELRRSSIALALPTFQVSDLNHTVGWATGLSQPPGADL